MSAPLVQKVCQSCGVVCKHPHCFALEEVLELEESKLHCPQLQDIDVEGGLFLGPQAPHSVMKEGAAPAESQSIRA